MLFLHYRLDTFKSQAKTLKKLLKETGEPCTTMQALDIISRAHGAESWNALYCTHQRAINANENSSEEYLFIDEAPHRIRAHIFSKITQFFLEHLNAHGMAFELPFQMLNSMESQYLPVSSQFFQRKDRSVTDFNDMYGNIALLSDVPGRHHDVFKLAIHPSILSNGGVAFLSRSEADDIFLASVKSPNRPVFISLLNMYMYWGKNADWSKMEAFYLGLLTEAARNKPEYCPLFAYIEIFFYCLNAFERERCPLRSVDTRLSVAQLKTILEDSHFPEQARNEATSRLQAILSAGLEDPHNIPFGTIMGMLEQHITPLLRVFTYIHSMFGQRENGVELCQDNIPDLNSLFTGDTPVYFICETQDGFNNTEHPAIERYICAGILALFEHSLKQHQAQKRKGAKVTQSWLYITKNCIVMPNTFPLISYFHNSVLKTILSSCSPGEGKFSRYGLSHIAYATAIAQATHIIDLDPSMQCTRSDFLDPADANIVINID